MAEIKKILVNRPNIGDRSQYNFDENDTNQLYVDSTGLPKNNDKFQKKDLFTRSVGDDINEKIIERNLKYEAESFIKIENLYISNTGVDGTVKNNHVAAWIFSQEAYGGDPTRDGYTTIKNKLNEHDEWKFYSQGFGTRGEGTDIGNIDNVEGSEIVSNFGADSPQVQLGDFEGQTLDFNSDGELDAFKLSNLETSGLQTSLFNESQYNPIFIIVWMRGHKKVAWPVKTDERRRRYDIFKISNEELFQKSGNNFFGLTYQNNFTSATATRTGEGGGGARKAAWRVTSLSLQINSQAGVENLFSDVGDYEDAVKQVLPRVSLNANSFNSVEWLSLVNPKAQLDNNQLSGGDDTMDVGNLEFGTNALSRHPDFFPLTTFGFSQNDRLAENYIDLQSYNYDFDSILKASSPLNVTFEVKGVNFDGSELQKYSQTPLLDSGTQYFYYFVIDWNDEDEKFLTIDDWLNSKPENDFEYLEKINQNLYKLKKIRMFEEFSPNEIEVENTLEFYSEFPEFIEEFNIDSDRNIVEYDTGNQFGNPFYYNIKFFGKIDDQDIYEWRASGRNDIADYLEENEFNLPMEVDGPVTQNQLNIFTGGGPFDDGGFTVEQQLQIYFSVDTSDLNPENQIPKAGNQEYRLPSSFINIPEYEYGKGLSNVYTTPGIKNVKFIMFSSFEALPYEFLNDFQQLVSPEFEIGRWKLCTSRFYLDIPPSEYPDFSDVGGADYTTIPWPFTTVMIGGVSENSKYKKSVRNTLSGGKIGKFDIIDEKFLINDLENDELGVNIETMDLEQIRYFNTGVYDINTLLNISLEGTSETIYDTNINFFSDIDVAQSLGYDNEFDPNFLATLPFPEYFEQFNVSQGSSTPIIDSVDASRWNNFFRRPDVSSLILYLIGEVEFPTEYTYPNYVNAFSTVDDIPSGVVTNIENFYNDFSFWDGETNKFPLESSVGQIFISDNLDNDLKQNCKLELNTGNLSGNSILDTSGNSNKGLLIGDYKVKKLGKGQPMRRDSFIKVPKKTNNSKGAL
tara:strand:+ start:554 stop:3613 length:3060 start_codon:yes stop_codon:yes gene_type:complete